MHASIRVALTASALLAGLVAGQASAQLHGGQPDLQDPVSASPVSGGPVSSGPVSGMPQAQLPPAATTPRGAEATLKTLRGWFRGYEFVPTEAQMTGLGPDLVPALITLAKDNTQPIVQARAISSMVYARNDVTRLYLTQLAEDAAADSLLRRKAVLVLAEQYGVDVMALMRAVFVASPEDAPLREACARGLRAAGEAALPIRQDLLAAETVDSVKALLNLDKQIQ